jgi:hypothetical protein
MRYLVTIANIAWITLAAVCAGEPAKAAPLPAAVAADLEPVAKLWLTVSGERCGKKPAKDFASEAFCDRPLAWNPSTKKFEYAPVASVRMIE